MAGEFFRKLVDPNRKFVITISSGERRNSTEALKGAILGEVVGLAASLDYGTGINHLLLFGGVLGAGLIGAGIWYLRNIVRETRKQNQPK